MLNPFKNFLSNKRIVLASSSPRRLEILKKTGLHFEVIPSKFEENLDKEKYLSITDYVLDTAFQKTKQVYSSLADSSEPPFLVIGADTVVAIDGKIFEKPKDKQCAFSMLKSLSNNKHTVITGLILFIRYQDKEDCIKEIAETEVEFDNLSDHVIQSYIDTGDPFDKAGGYGIQSEGCTLIKGINGDFYNVMGFPVNLFARTLANYIRLNIL